MRNRSTTSAPLVFCTYRDLSLVREPGGLYTVRRGAEVLRAISAIEAGAILEDPSMMAEDVPEADWTDAVDAAFGRYRGWCESHGMEA